MFSISEVPVVGLPLIFLQDMDKKWALSQEPRWDYLEIFPARTVSFLLEKSRVIAPGFYSCLELANASYFARMKSMKD